MHRYLVRTYGAIVAILCIVAIANGASEIRKLGANDLYWGTDNATSAGGKSIVGINGSYLPDNSVPLDKLVPGTEGYVVKMLSGIPTWAADSTDNTATADNSILPAKLRSTSGTAGNTTYYRGDGAWATVVTSISDNTITNTMLYRTGGTPSATTYYRGDNTWATPTFTLSDNSVTPEKHYYTSGTPSATTYYRGDNTRSTPGDVTGPASATDSGIALYNGTGGKTLKSSTYLVNQSVRTTDNVTFNSVTTGAADNTHYLSVTNTTAPGSPSTGWMYYDNTMNTMRVYVSSAWSNLTRVVSVPDNTTSACRQGQIASDNAYTYFCYADNNWRRWQNATW